MTTNKNNKNKMIKNKILHLYFNIKKFINLNFFIYLPYLSIPSISLCNDQMTETVSSLTTSTSTSLGLVTGIVVFGIVSYVTFRALKYLFNGTQSNIEELTRVIDVTRVTDEETQSTGSENTDPEIVMPSENGVAVIEPLEDYVSMISHPSTITEVENIHNLIHTSNTNYIVFGGPQSFSYIINSSNNIGFGKCMKYLIWSRRHAFNGATDEDVCEMFDLNDITISPEVYSKFSFQFSQFLNEIVPLLGADKWRINSMDPLYYINMAKKIQEYMQLNDIYVDMAVFGPKNGNMVFLNSSYFLSVDTLNALNKLQEILIQLQLNTPF